MEQVLLALVIFTGMLLTNPNVLSAEPDYAKWGRVAMAETAKAYSGASIADYKYEGRFAVSEGRAEERFTLWLKQDGREFGVRVTISVATATETLIQVKLSEWTPN